MMLLKTSSAERAKAKMKSLMVLLAAATTSYAPIKLCCHAFAFTPPKSNNLCRPSITHVFLFDLKQRLNQRSPQQQISRNRIPEEEIYYLSRGFGFSEEGDDPLQLPYTIDLTTSPTTTRISGTNNENTEQQQQQQAASRLLLRHLEVEDIKPILPEILREFGAIETSSSTGSKLGDEVATWIENFLFSFTVLVGLDQRVERRKKGYGTSSNNNVPPDHNVICLVEVTPVTNDDATIISYTEQIVGIAELSWQPPDPTRNAPPFVLPYFVKVLISRFIPNNGGTSNRDDELKVPKGYVSNVLTWKNRRGLGYSRVLMAALEGIARRWGCDDIRLHVDADEVSGKVARGLYWSLGYEAVPDRGNNKVGNFDWMGPSMANQGLYLVEGVPLLYLRKSLNEEDDAQ